MKHRRFGWLLIGALAALITTTMSFAATPKTSSETAKVTGSSYVYNQNGSSVYVAPCLNKIYGKLCENGAWLKNGYKVKMVCWLDSKYPYTGNYKSVRWFYIKLTYGIFNWSTAYGYVHSSFVYYQTTVPHC